MRAFLGDPYLGQVWPCLSQQVIKLKKGRELRGRMDDTDIARIVSRLYPAGCATESELCEMLGKDADALSETISKMDQLGYGMVRSGDLWRMTRMTCRLLPWELGRDLGTRAIGRRVEYFDSIGSTQDYALKLAQSGEKGGHVVVASVQSSGRGRRARRWVSPDGGVWMSIIVPPDCGSQESLVTLAASCALCDAVRDVLDIDASLVWPNDLVVNKDGRPHKVAGIIADAVAGSDGIRHVVLGVGINFQVDEEAINCTIRGESVLPAATLVAKDLGVSPVKTVQVFLQNLERMLEACAEPGKIAAEFSRRTSMIGRTVSITADEALVSGIVSKIDGDGALIIRSGSKDMRFVTGQVVRVS